MRRKLISASVAVMAAAMICGCGQKQQESKPQAETVQEENIQESDVQDTAAQENIQEKEQED